MLDQGKKNWEFYLFKHMGTVSWFQLNEWLQFVHRDIFYECWVMNYCKSTNFGVLLYLVNCVFSLIFVAANIYIDHTSCMDGPWGDPKFNSRQITLFWEMPKFIAAKICWFTVFGSFQMVFLLLVLSVFRAWCCCLFYWDAWLYGSDVMKHWCCHVWRKSANLTLVCECWTSFNIHLYTKDCRSYLSIFVSRRFCEAFTPLFKTACAYFCAYFYGIYTYIKYSCRFKSSCSEM